MPSSASSVVVSWLPPHKPNGIIRKYTIYCSSSGSGQPVSYRRGVVDFSTDKWLKTGTRETLMWLSNKQGQICFLKIFLWNRKTFCCAFCMLWGWWQFHLIKGCTAFVVSEFLCMCLCFAVGVRVCVCLRPIAAVSARCVREISSPHTAVCVHASSPSSFIYISASHHVARTTSSVHQPGWKTSREQTHTLTPTLSISLSHARTHTHAGVHTFE